MLREWERDRGTKGGEKSITDRLMPFFLSCHFWSPFLSLCYTPRRNRILTHISAVSLQNKTIKKTHTLKTHSLLHVMKVSSMDIHSVKVCVECIFVDLEMVKHKPLICHLFLTFNENKLPLLGIFFVWWLANSSLVKLSQSRHKLCTPAQKGTTEHTKIFHPRDKFIRWYKYLKK